MVTLMTHSCIAVSQDFAGFCWGHCLECDFATQHHVLHVEQREIVPEGLACVLQQAGSCTTSARPVRASQEVRLPRSTLSAVPGVVPRAAEPKLPRSCGGVARKPRSVPGVRGGRRSSVAGVRIAAAAAPGPRRLLLRCPVPATFTNPLRHAFFHADTASPRL